MCKGDLFCLFRCEVTQVHRNHSCLFFFDIQKFNQTFLTTSFKVPLAFIVRPFFFQQLLDVKFSHLDFIVFYNIQRSLNSSSIRAKANFFSSEVSQDRNLSLYSAVSSEGYEVVIKLVSIACKSYPVSIHKYFSLLLVQKICAGYLLKFLHSPILEFMDDFSSVGPNRCKCHQSQIFNQSTSLAFWSLCWANHTPMTIVELSRLCLLSLFGQCVRQSSHVRE